MCWFDVLVLSVGFVVVLLYCDDMIVVCGLCYLLFGCVWIGWCDVVVFLWIVLLLGLFVCMVFDVEFVKVGLVLLVVLMELVLW